MKNIIPIFFTIDDNYAKYAACAIKSIIVNSSKDYEYNIIIVNQGLTEETKEKLKKLETENFKIIFKEMKEGLSEITDREENRLRCDYFTLTIYLRLFIADMFKEYDKAIYIDSDIVVPGDISELYNHELSNNIFGACSDLSVQNVPELVNYIENAIGVDRLKYINSGVLLMNLKMMRDLKFSEKFITLLNKYHFDTIAPDQDYINAMCNGKILYLDNTWDAMPNNNTKPLDNPKLIHYNLFQKPWCYDDIQYESYFWKYAKNSGYYDELVKFKANYSDEQKQSDETCLINLINKGNSIPNYELNFKKAHEKYKDIRI